MSARAIAFAVNVDTDDWIRELFDAKDGHPNPSVCAARFVLETADRYSGYEWAIAENDEAKELRKREAQWFPDEVELFFG